MFLGFFFYPHSWCLMIFNNGEFLNFLCIALDLEFILVKVEFLFIHSYRFNPPAYP
jgi:hypothetical protein